MIECIPNVPECMKDGHPQPEIKPRPISLETIVKAVCEYRGVTLFELGGKSRLRRFAYSRQLIYYFARTLTSHTLKEIGDGMCRDHTSVVKNLRTINGHLENSEEIRYDVHTLTLTIAAKVA